MGCDIHGVMEKNFNGEWKAVNSQFDWERDYVLFGFLAGFRNRDVYCLGEPKGLPEGFDFFKESTENDSLYHNLHNHEELSYRKMRNGRICMGDFGFTWHLFSDILAAEDRVNESLAKFSDSKYYTSIFDLSYFFDIIKSMVETLSEDQGRDLRIVVGFDS